LYAIAALANQHSSYVSENSQYKQQPITTAITSAVATKSKSGVIHTTSSPRLQLASIALAICQGIGSVGHGISLLHLNISSNSS